MPYADNALNFQRLGSLHMRLAFNGGADSGFQIDTGSVGIMVSADEIPGYTGKGEPGEITYSSSGVHLTGTWETVDVKFVDAKMPDGSPVIAHMPVLAVTRRECLGTGVNAAKCSPGPGHPHMLGIGFGRGDGSDWKVQQRNAFLMLNAMQQGRMRRGYVLTTKGVQLGLSAEVLPGRLEVAEAVAARVGPAQRLQRAEGLDDRRGHAGGAGQGAVHGHSADRHRVDQHDDFLARRAPKRRHSRRRADQGLSARRAVELRVHHRRPARPRNAAQSKLARA
ncbi:MAG: hypothetical protein QM699_00170 [Amaricoccus sp.]|uniref:hypothetical protein n=1 Tax=Amaricoccus sp. TaxID=1872485 RepID=UPI0039E2C19E